MSRLWVVMVLGLAPWLALGQDRGAARVTVYGNRDLGPVNRHLTGAGVAVAADGRAGGLWDPERGQPVPEVVTAAGACGVRLARWPSSCAAHTWNWKEAVGPVERRPGHAFGIPEFLRWCRAAGALPLITLGAWSGDHQDAADLVEYLNAPNDGRNPNGGTDWAAVRAADGQVVPHGVVWFEFDGLAFHGNDAAAGQPVRERIAAADYAARYLRMRRAMRAVDSAIRLGAAVPLGVDTWSRPVLEEAGDDMDLAVTALQLPEWTGDASPEQSNLLLQASLASGAQVAEAFARANAMVAEACGRRDLPWLVIDWGNAFRQEKPVPYRHTLAAALGQAEQLRVMMDPRQRIAMAALRPFVGQEWAPISGGANRNEPLRSQALAMVMELYAQHLGDVRVASEVTGETWDFAGAAGVLPRQGEAQPEAIEGDDLLGRGTTWTVTGLPEVPHRCRGTLLDLQFPGKDLDYQHAAIRLPAAPGQWYRVRGMLRTSDLTGGSGICLQVGAERRAGDALGHVFSHDLVGSSDWTEVTVDYRTPAEAEALVIKARRRRPEAGAGAVSGQASYRLLSVHALRPANFGGVPYVTALASRRRHGPLTVILTNTGLDREQAVTVAVEGVALKTTSEARVRLLTGLQPWSNNLGRDDGVRLWMRTPARAGATWTVTLPPHSLAAVEIVP
ncbi:MAG: hypothetical protein GX595_11045 [Lentisphaerae bacterium]|nr:hypothetical protein [Lentisphaerota bacterium]